MNILYIGDIMAEAGIETVEKVLPSLRIERSIDVVIAQSENVSEGKGMTIADYQRLRRAGVDGFTGGNHTPSKPEIFQLLTDTNCPVTGPANMADCPGPDYKYVGEGSERVVIISLLGQVVGRDADKVNENPLKAIDRILALIKNVPRAATVVNFHGDFSSEKVVIGHYLDGRVSIVVGDHWHVPTADARVLSGGTAHMTDVGMCGALNSSLGVTYDSIVPRWRDGTQTRNVIETVGPRQFNALLTRIDSDGIALSTEHVQIISHH